MKSRLSKAIAYSVIFAFVVGLIVATAPRAVVGAAEVSTGSTEAVIRQTIEPATENTISNPIKDSTEPSNYCGICTTNGKPGYIGSGRCIVCF